MPAHYGEPFREQRTLAERVGVVDRSNRGVVTVSGEDRLSWLHTLTTQHVSNLPAWRGTEALILSPQGHIVHHMVVVDDGETTWLDTEPGAAPALLAFLERMRFMLRVEPVDVSDRWAMLSLVGPENAEALRAIDVPPLTEPWSAAALPGGGWARRAPWPDQHAVDVLVPRERLAEVWASLDAAGVTRCGLDAYEALRVAERRPRFGNETDDRTLPYEARWRSAVHLNKGCYPGQETVAKVHNMGQPPRRLVLLQYDGTSDELPATGTPVEYNERSVGFVGTAARHYELGNIVLAMVKRNTPDGATVTTGDLRAVIDPGEPDDAVELGGDDYGAGRRRVAEFMARRRADAAGR